MERREASARRFARAVPVRHGGWTTRLPAFRFPSLFDRVGRAKRNPPKDCGGLRRFAANSPYGNRCLTKLARKRAARTGSYCAPLPCGERSSAARVRGPLRDSEPHSMPSGEAPSSRPSPRVAGRRRCAPINAETYDAPSIQQILAQTKFPQAPFLPGRPRADRCGASHDAAALLRCAALVAALCAARLQAASALLRRADALSHRRVDLYAAVAAAAGEETGDRRRPAPYRAGDAYRMARSGAPIQSLVSWGFAQPEQPQVSDATAAADKSPAPPRHWRSPA